METLNRQARQLGRWLTFKKVLYAYRRYSVNRGVQYTFDLLLVHKRLKMSKIVQSSDIRRYVHVQQSFGEPRLIEDSENYLSDSLQRNNDVERVNFVMPVTESRLNHVFFIENCGF